MLCNNNNHVFAKIREAKWANSLRLKPPGGQGQPRPVAAAGSAGGAQLEQRGHQVAAAQAQMPVVQQNGQLDGADCRR